MRWALLTVAVVVVSAQIMEAPPQAWEERLQQAGAFNGYFSWVGGLRCQQPGEALVGVRTRRGNVLDQIEIACASVTCRGSNCSWTRSYTAGSAGNRPEAIPGRG